MARCQKLWKNLSKSGRNSCEKVEQKLAQKSKIACSGCSVWWKNVRFSELVFGFCEKDCVGGGKENSSKEQGIHKIHKIHIAYNYNYLIK